MTAPISAKQENKKRRIVFAWNYLPWGGAQVYLLAIMKVARGDWDMQAVLPAKSSAEILRYLEQLNVPYKLVDHHLDIDPATTFRRKLERQWARVRVEWDVFRELLKFDTRDTVFQLDVAPWQSIAYLSAMSLRGAKVFITLHNFLPEGWGWREWIWRSRFRFVSYLPGLRFFTSNEDTRNRLKGWVNDKFWDRIRVTFTAVNPPQIVAAESARFDKRETLRRLGIATDDFIVLCVGNFIDRKGRWVFLEAARSVVQSDDRVTFVWLTPQLPLAEDQEKIAEFELADKFRVVHAEEIGMDRIDVLKFFRIADVFTLPSYVEGLPIALLEAMALGRPSISTNVYAIPEAIKHLETGMLIEAGDSAALADAISKLKADSDLRERLGRSGREYVLKHFDERDAAASAIEAYEEALNDAH